MKTEYICGLPVDNLNFKQIEEDITKYLDINEKMVITSVNPQITLQAERHNEVKKYIHRATHRIADGVGILWISRLFGGEIRERITGIDVMNRCLVYAHQNKQSIFLYGAKKEVVVKAAKNIQKKYPGLEVVGYLHGYTTKKNETILKKINEAKPTFLFVALGSPKQEIFLERNVDNLDAKVFLDVGGTFDVLAGEIKRAPSFFIKMNLEWLYRSITMRRFDRLVQIPRFLINAIRFHREDLQSEKDIEEERKIEN